MPMGVGGGTAVIGKLIAPPAYAPLRMEPFSAWTLRTA